MQIFGTKQVATIGPRKHIGITYPTPRDEAVTPFDLPLAEQVTPQVSYTVLAGDLPVLSGINPNAVVFTAYLYMAGQNLSGGAAVVSWDLHVDGNSTVIGSNVVADGNYYMISTYGAVGIQAGSVIELFAWSDSSGVAVTYQAFAVLVGKINAIPSGALIFDFAYAGVSFLPILPILTSASIYTIASMIVESGSFLSREVAGDISFEAVVLTAHANVLLLTNGGSAGGAGSVLIEDAATQFYAAQYAPTDISFYPTSIRVE